MFEGFSSFVENQAGIGGLAIESFGEIRGAGLGVFFANNSFHCPLGQYSFDDEADGRSTLEHVSQIVTMYEVY